ncbi:ADP-ribosylation factor 1-like isoform X2 [Erpetoichthys calabaricus]|nr:ADP-ribosylation factor 1-like isoform X2 [Erpetoichthys calabaricus]
MLGLDAAGKTTILYKLRLKEIIPTIPTIGFNVEIVKPVHGVSLTVWDGSGQTRVWSHYFSKTQGLLFVVDSADTERFGEAQAQLQCILEHEEMRRVPLVILANKQDLPGAWQPEELVEKMGLRKIMDHEWLIQGCCAVSGAGINEPVQHLADMIKRHQTERY